MDKKVVITLIILILIPLAILSFLGFKIIYYQEEKEKRKVYAEQRELISQIHEHFRQQVITKYRYFSQLIEKEEINFSSLKKLTLENRNKGMKLVFFMDITGQLIFPNYVEFKSSNISSLFLENKFYSLIEKAKKFENNGNYNSAMSEYHKVLNQSAQLPSTYIAQIKYNLANLYFKTKNFKKAILLSKDISTKFPFLLNQEGIPFLLANSLLIGKSYLLLNQYQEIIRVFQKTVKSFIEGELILTNKCMKYLKGMREIMIKINSPQYLIQDIDFLLSQISFGEIFYSKIERALKKILTSHSREVEFLISDPDEPPALLLYYPIERENLKGILGFEYDLNQIIEEISNNVKSEELYFEIGVERKNYKDKLLHSEILSPLSPKFKIFIFLKGTEFSQLQRLRTFLMIAIIFFLISSLIFGLFIVVRDALRKVELSRLRSEFISNVTHELKAPLSSIRLYAETLMLNRVKEKNKKIEYLKIIMNQSRRLSRLIDNVLDFSRIETGQKDYHFKKENISKIIKDAVKLFDYELKKEKFKLNLNLPEKPTSILVDKDAISQVFINLISNAIKFSQDKKEINITLTKEKNWVKITVEDKGVGIPDKDLPHIFKKFYRVKSKETEGKTGAGIGLSLVKHIIETHEGRIYVKSGVGKGTIFTIYLPLTNKGL